MCSFCLCSYFFFISWAMEFTIIFLLKNFCIKIVGHMRHVCILVVCFLWILKIVIWKSCTPLSNFKSYSLSPPNSFNVLLPEMLKSGFCSIASVSTTAIRALATASAAAPKASSSEAPLSWVFWTFHVDSMDHIGKDKHRCVVRGKMPGSVEKLMKFFQAFPFVSLKHLYVPMTN